VALLVREARPTDFLEALDDTGRRPAARTRAHFGLYARQVTGGPSLAVVTWSGDLVALAGLYPDGQDAEAWFAPGPAMEANLWPALALMRRALARLAVEANGLTARAYIHPRSVAGAAVARLLGFQAAGEVETPIGRLASFSRRFG
jgi:hypothetical protein